MNHERRCGTRIVWHRRDLRIRDNELYHPTDSRHGECDIDHKYGHGGSPSAEGSIEILPLFVFDPSDYSPRVITGIDDSDSYRTVMHGPYFARQLHDAVHSLRSSLREVGMELLIQNGDPLDVIPDLVSKLGATQVAWSEIPGYYECRQSSRLKEVLLPLLGSEGVITTCSYTLYPMPDM